MKWVFDWLREQIEEKSVEVNNVAVVSLHNAIVSVNRAQLKWESEVVRCKDCKYWEDVDRNWCTEHVKFCNIGTYLVGENGYCVYGERKPIKILEVE